MSRDPVQALGIFQIPLRLQDQRQHRGRGHDVQVLRAEQCLASLENSSQQRLRFCMIAASLAEKG